MYKSLSSSNKKKFPLFPTNTYDFLLLMACSNVAMKIYLLLRMLLIKEPEDIYNTYSTLALQRLVTPFVIQLSFAYLIKRYRTTFSDNAIGIILLLSCGIGPFENLYYISKNAGYSCNQYFRTLLNCKLLGDLSGSLYISVGLNAVVFLYHIIRDIILVKIQQENNVRVLLHRRIFDLRDCVLLQAQKIL